MAPDNKVYLKDCTLYYCKKLKWYQKILQKLHIKNYYHKVTTAVDITTTIWNKE